ncbi:MAG: hypothetical protein AABY64_09705 [Bdellovibrionota bacterium]
MNPRVIVIDEPIHIHDETACKLWQKALWMKELGYRNHYKSSVLPVGVDDFVASHLIVADQKKNGELEPMVMYKSIRKSQADKFKIPFGGLSLLNTTKYQNDKEIISVINDGGDISYDSSWTINPIYKSDKETSQLLRDFVTMFCCNHHKEFGFSRWLTAGVKQFKIDDYFEWLGGKQILPEFQLEIIDNQFVRMFYIPDTLHLPAEPLATAKKMDSYWNNRMVFVPEKSVYEKVA